MGYALRHEEYTSKNEVQEVLYLLEMSGERESVKRKVASGMLTITYPRDKKSLARTKARRIWSEVYSTLSTYGYNSAKELLEYEKQHQEQYN